MPGRVRRARTAALLLICAGQFVLVLDVSIVNVALPSIQHDLHVTQANLQWLVTAYALTFGGFLLLGGRAADMLGRRRMFMVGLTLFAAASLLGGVTQSGTMLIASRLLQGLGAAMVSPAALSLLTTTFHEGAERNRALGVWGAVAASGGAAGVLLGGILTQSIGWRAVFLVNVPIAVVVIALVPRLLAESHDRSGHRPDVPGALTATSALIALVFGLSQGEQHSFADPRAWAPLIAAVALLTAFVLTEQRVRDPLVPFRIFRLPTVLGADLGILLIASVMAAMVFFLTLYLQEVLGLSPIETGLAWLPMPLCIAASAQLASRNVARIGARILLAGGLALMAGGMLLLSGISANGSYFSDALPGMIPISIGVGLGFTTATVAATSGVADAEQGLASGLLITSQQVGWATGLAVLATIAAAETKASTGSTATTLVNGFQLAFALSAGLALIGAAIVLILVHDDDCIGELRRRRMRSLLHGTIPQPVSGHTSPCWPAVTDLHKPDATPVINVLTSIQ